MNQYLLHHGNCIEVMRGMADCSVDSVVTDPPYHLTENSRGGHARTNNPSMPHGRHRIGDKGFMGKVWDGGDIAQRVELWAEALRVLKPGGHLLAFSGTRTQHRMVCAIEDAGFEIRDQVGWAYGSGFPKSRNISEHDMDGADADQWTGWGTALKPAWEPICVARKPMAKGLTVAANVLQFGTGAINIAGCKVEPTGESRDRVGEASQDNRYTEAGSTNFAAKPGVRGGAPDGRWPANIIHDGSDEVVALFPQSTSGANPTRRGGLGYHGAVGQDECQAPRGAETGSAARFFYCAKASRSDRNEGLISSSTPAVETDATMRECETADWSTRNGNHHPTVKPTDLMAYLCRLVTPPGGGSSRPIHGLRVDRQSLHARRLSVHRYRHHCRIHPDRKGAHFIRTRARHSRQCAAGTITAAQSIFNRYSHGGSVTATKSIHPRPAAAHLAMLYTTMELGCPDIGWLYDRDASTVRDWLVKAGIPTRARGTDPAQWFKKGGGDPRSFSGTKHSLASKERIRVSSLGRIPYQRDGKHWLHTVPADQNPNWKGGATPERQEFYRSAEWKAAVKEVWARDNGCCRRCALDWRTVDRTVTPTFHIHHVVSFAVASLRAEVSNLVLLCRPCHLWVHSNENTAGLFLAALDAAQDNEVVNA